MKLLGYVDKGNDCLIITEYVPNGTLRDHLDGKVANLKGSPAHSNLSFRLNAQFFCCLSQVCEEIPWILISDLRSPLMLLMA